MTSSEILNFLIFLLNVKLTCFGLSTNSDSLILVHVIFRHGDRTPDLVGRYPKDPYLHDNYFPYGSGELTNRGKRRAYALGQTLRQRYNEFLGELYLPTLLEARSTGYTRTQMTLLVVLASLFPAREKQKWHKFQMWQPIPYTSKPQIIDKLLFGFRACPNFQAYLKEPEVTKQVEQISKKYSRVFDYISKNSGWNSTDFFRTSYLYHTLTTEKENDRVLPEWTSRVYPDPIEELASMAFSVYTGSTKLKQIGAGYLLKKIINDTDQIIAKKLKTKLFLYSGHDINVAFFLQTLNVFKSHVPPYGAHILVEVHYIDGQYGVKIFYGNYKGIQTGYLKIPGCSEFCPLDRFRLLMKKYIPTEDVCGMKIK